MFTPNAETRAALRDQPENVVLAEVLAKLSISQWDVLIAGDGSGNAWNSPSGWAGVLIERAERSNRRWFCGSMNTGSINLAEGMPVWQALNWYDQHYGKERLKSRGVLQVHVVTDSEIVRRWGTIATCSFDDELARQHLFVWAGLRALRRLGYAFTFHWAPRLTNGFNWASDLLAGLCRELQPADLAIDTLHDRLRQAMQQLTFTVDVYGIHPDTR